MFYVIYNNNNLLTSHNQNVLSDYGEVQILPDDYVQGKYIVQDGELILNPDWSDIELQQVKEAKIQENDSARDEALNQGVTYKDVLFDSDTDQKVNLLAIVSTMSDEDEITWFGKDNQPLLCNKQDLINIGGLITVLHNHCWTLNASIKGAINEAQTIEEVEAIEIDYTMPVEESENIEESEEINEG